MNMRYRWLLAAGASVALVGALSTQALAQPARARAPLGAGGTTPRPAAGPAATSPSRARGGGPGSTMAKPAGSAGPPLPGGAVPAGFQPQSVTFISASDGWVLGSAPCGARDCLAVLRTGDGGKTWRSVPAPPADLTTLGGKPGIYQLVFADSRDGLAYGPRLYATHDGGSAWQRVRLPRDGGGPAARGRAPPRRR